MKTVKHLLLALVFTLLGIVPFYMEELLRFGFLWLQKTSAIVDYFLVVFGVVLLLLALLIYLALLFFFISESWSRPARTKRWKGALAEAKRCTRYAGEYDETKLVFYDPDSLFFMFSGRVEQENKLEQSYFYLLVEESCVRFIKTIAWSNLRFQIRDISLGGKLQSLAKWINRLSKEFSFPLITPIVSGVTAFFLNYSAQSDQDIIDLVAQNTFIDSPNSEFKRLAKNYLITNIDISVYGSEDTSRKFNIILPNKGFMLSDMEKLSLYLLLWKKVPQIHKSKDMVSVSMKYALDGV